MRYFRELDIRVILSSATKRNELIRLSVLEVVSASSSSIRYYPPIPLWFFPHLLGTSTLYAKIFFRLAVWTWRMITTAAEWWSSKNKMDNTGDRRLVNSFIWVHNCGNCLVCNMYVLYCLINIGFYPYKQWIIFIVHCTLFLMGIVNVQCTLWSVIGQHHQHTWKKPDDPISA